MEDGKELGPKMKMFVWDEDFLTDYTSGLAVGVAETVEEARELIVKNQEEWYRDFVRLALKKPPDKILDLPAGVCISGGS